MVTSGEVYFVWLCTMSKGSIVELPIDVRQIIYKFTFPRIIARCCACDNVLLVQSLHSQLMQTRSYTVFGNDFHCLTCDIAPQSALLLLSRPDILRSIRLHDSQIF